MFDDTLNIGLNISKIITSKQMLMGKREIHIGTFGLMMTYITTCSLSVEHFDILQTLRKNIVSDMSVY